ncbi:rab-GTPase-TBC domain-containing protein [Lactarius akahatsu]|uniref:Rab-GTPase-TBC domain-containing protein n=1 Tax=Lactarius akahatsu TaxID=416441 RepID=A0AAD4LRC4_9AGAM|nr:rab-GTPase-TBC domain-containing protein [Lactarius akahatsu]
MDSQQLWAADTEQVIFQERVGKTPPAPTPFDLDDDAFADGDDNDPSYEFSSTVIRAELARAVSPPQQDEIPTDIEESLDADAAGGTSKLHAGISGSLDVSDPLPNGSQLYAKFDTVSLSESPIDEKHKSVHDEEHDDAQHRAVHHSKSESRPTSIEGDDPETPSGQSILVMAAPTPSHPLSPVSSPISSSSPSRPSSSHKVHKVTRSTGPSALEKVISKTRPPFLPPKSRVEDQKHLSDWEKMMERSRAAEDKRRKALQERRLARELRVEQSLHIWEKGILPDWKIVHRNPAMRKLWWGGIPTKLRATMWQHAVGNPLALSKDTYRICLARAKRLLEAGTFPKTSLDQIEQDVRSTLPSLHIFHPDSGPMYGELKDMLHAWVVSRSDEGSGYVPGVAKIAAMILLNMPASPGFIVMKNLLERHCMRSFYGEISANDDVEAYYRIFDTLLADGMPKSMHFGYPLSNTRSLLSVYFNFKQHHISPSAYLRDWIIPLFIDHLPFEACARLWDVILLEGDAFLYRASLAMLAILEPRLFFPDRQELLELLRGENKAALEVARREGRAMDGGKYEIYGVDEEVLWDRIDAMNDWWKESTWTRLLHRELPDI